jgi:hypothetical protein
MSKTVGFERQLLGCTDMPFDVGEPLVVLQPGRALDHRRRRIDADRMRDDGCERAHDEPRTAGDVERALPGRGASRLDQERKRRLVPDARRQRERERLPGNWSRIVSGATCVMLRAWGDLCTLSSRGPLRHRSRPD